MTGGVDASDPIAPPLLLREAEGGGFEWPRPQLGGTLHPVPFSAPGVKQLRAAGHDLVVTGKVFDKLVERTPAAWDVAQQVTVFARMSPEGKEAVAARVATAARARLMCGDGGNDVGALKTADVGISLLTGFGNVNAETADSKKASTMPAAAADAEKQLEAQAVQEQAKRAEAGKLQAAEFKVKRAELMGKQRQWVEEEIRARAARGETGMTAQLGATMAVSNRLRQELAREQRALSQKYGVANASSEQLDLMDGEGGELPMVKLGDASIAAPFASKLPSIRSCVGIIDRCCPKQPCPSPYVLAPLPQPSTEAAVDLCSCADLIRQGHCTRRRCSSSDFDAPASSQLSLSVLSPRSRSSESQASEAHLNSNPGPDLNPKPEPQPQPEPNPHGALYRIRR